MILVCPICNFHFGHIVLLTNKNLIHIFGITLLFSWCYQAVDRHLYTNSLTFSISTLDHSVPLFPNIWLHYFSEHSGWNLREAQFCSPVTLHFFADCWTLDFWRSVRKMLPGHLISLFLCGNVMHSCARSTHQLPCTIPKAENKCPFAKTYVRQWIGLGSIQRTTFDIATSREQFHGTPTSKGQVPQPYSKHCHFESKCQRERCRVPSLMNKVACTWDLKKIYTTPNL